MGSNNNSKSMLSMPKNKNSLAMLGGIALLVAVVIAIYYMQKSIASNRESFSNNGNNNISRKMSNKLSDNTEMKPNLKPEKGECVVALFYADWCPHCTHFKPDYKKAMAQLNGKMGKDGKKLRLEMVDCDAHKELGRKYDVSGYPTVKIIKDDGTQVEYGGERTFEGLRKYLVSDD